MNDKFPNDEIIGALIKAIPPEAFVQLHEAMQRQALNLINSLAPIARAGKLYPYIGNIDCVNNARSPLLQCAINPTGSCEKCKDFESATLQTK